MVTAASENKDLTLYTDAFEIAVDFNEPHFELGARLYRLWRGQAPDILDRTFSKIMLNQAHSMVNDRIPKLSANMFGSDDFVSLEALTPELESGRSDAEAWLRFMFKDESKLNIMSEITPTLQSACIQGTGYRMPCIRSVKQGKKWNRIITVRDLDYFQVLPMPDGGLLNPMDRYSEEAVSGFFFVDWMTNEQIKGLEKYKGYDKEEARKCFESKVGTAGGLEDTYQNVYDIIGGVTYSSKTDWRQRMTDVEGLSGRRRVVNWFRRDAWWVIVQDRYIVYKGPNPMPDGILPLVKYTITNDFKNWHGIGSLEMIEDMLLAVLMNFNYRFDHLARVLFPTKWIRKDVMGSRPESDFYDRPYSVFQFPREVLRISDAVFYDRAPEITSQTFLDEDRLKMFVQEVSGLPNYSKGMGGSGTLGNETATGIVSLIRQAGARIDMESMLLESQGLAQEARLLLILAEKHITEDLTIRNPRADNGFGWSVIDAEALTDGYTVKTHGTRYLSNKEQTFQKLMALYPFWNNNPMIDQYELNSQIADVADALPDKERVLKKPVADMMAQQGQQGIMMGEQGGMPMGPGGMPVEPGGLASMQSGTNPARSVANRTSVEPNTGRQVRARNSLPAEVAL